MKARSDYQAATKAIVALAAEEGSNVKYNPKEDRFRSDALDPDLEKWPTLVPGITVGGSGKAKWYWNDDDWKEHKW